MKDGWQVSREVEGMGEMREIGTGGIREIGEIGEIGEVRII